MSVIENQHERFTLILIASKDSNAISEMLQVNALTEESAKFQENNRVLQENTEKLEATNNQVWKIYEVVFLILLF